MLAFLYIFFKQTNVVAETKYFKSFSPFYGILNPDLNVARTLYQSKDHEIKWSDISKYFSKVSLIQYGSEVAITVNNNSNSSGCAHLLHLSLFLKWLWLPFFHKLDFIRLFSWNQHYFKKIQSCLDLKLREDTLYTLKKNLDFSQREVHMRQSIQEWNK